MAEEEEDDVCNFESGDYKTVRLEDGRISLFKKDKYYTFSEGDIRHAEVNPITDIYPHSDTPIEECFVTNGNIYYLRGNDAVVYKGQIPQVFHWQQLEASINHLIIRKNGQEIGFFVPPKTSSNGFSRSISRSNDMEIVSFGGGSISTSSINGDYRIRYNGWNVPIYFNAYVANKDNTLTFFYNHKYCVVRKNSKKRNFEWKDVSALFGC